MNASSRTVSKLIVIRVDSRDWQPGGKDRQILCTECRAHYKKTNELPPLNTGANLPTPSKDNSKEINGKEASKDGKEPAYLFRPVAESPDASPQRMRTRNKAAKEQNPGRARPKRGGELQTSNSFRFVTPFFLGTETPEPKTPNKQANNSSGSPLEKGGTSQPGTPNKKKGKAEKADTPTKNRKRAQEKTEEGENEEKELGLFKKKRDRAEVTDNFVFLHPLFCFPCRALPVLLQILGRSMMKLRIMKWKQIILMLEWLLLLPTATCLRLPA